MNKASKWARLAQAANDFVPKPFTTEGLTISVDSADTIRMAAHANFQTNLSTVLVYVDKTTALDLARWILDVFSDDPPA